jgi:hypothetical protein
VIEAGPGWAEDAVVFVHGNPDSARDWDDLRVRIRVGGPLPALRVAVRLDRGGKRLGASRRVRLVDKAGSLPIRLRRPLRSGRHTLTISARGLPRVGSVFRVR